MNETLWRCLTGFGLLWGTTQVRLPERFESWPAAQKQSYLWENGVRATRYGQLPSFLGLTPSHFFGSILALADFRTTFTHESDVMPSPRRKIIHAFGSVAPVVFEGNPNSSFSGLFRASKVEGLARISLAGPPGLIGFTPGMGLKLFIDGKPSVNLLTMNSVNGQGADHDPFARTFSNVIPPPQGIFLKLFEERFRMTVRNPEQLSMSAMASVKADGSIVSAPTVPHQILFVPAKETHIPSDSTRDVREDLAGIAPGTVLYDVYAKASADSEPELVGRLTLKDRFVASEFGDTQLFFRHTSDTLKALGF